MATTKAKKRVVWSLEWDNGWVSGWAKVYERAGQYFFRDDDGNKEGPFDSLKQAVTDTDANQVNFTTLSVSSDELTAPEIAAMLHLALDEGEDGYGWEIVLNGELWVYDGGKFRAATAAERAEAGLED
jgi:hypothetical protein